MSDVKVCGLEIDYRYGEHSIWKVSLVRPASARIGPPVPVGDLPPDVREALLAWLVGPAPHETEPEP